MSIFFYHFGYERPDEQKSNERNGTDFESSGYFLIDADDEQAALKWGDELANWFVQEAFRGKISYQWINSEFASWIEHDEKPPSENNFPAIKIGDYPDLKTAMRALL